MGYSRERWPKSGGSVAIACLLPLVGVATVWAEQFQSFSGNTSGGPFFNRPNETPAPTGVSVRYRAQEFGLEFPAGTPADSTARCAIYSAQDFDGFLLLYQAPFDPQSPLDNLIAVDDDGETGIGSSRLGVFLSQDTTYVLVTTGFAGDDAGPFLNLVHCDLGQTNSNVGVQPVHGDCFFAAAGFPREQQVCLQDRFAVKIDQVTNHPTGRATPVRFGSTDSAFFWFYNDRNFEVLIKVLNGCGVNGHWWVFFAGTTNQGHRVQVGDVVTQLVKTYTRTPGPPARAETDTAAFPCS